MKYDTPLHKENIVAVPRYSMDRRFVETSLHPESLELGIHRIRIEACLTFGEQLAGHGRNIGHARHRQKYPFCAGIERAAAIQIDAR